jgi:cell division initiation protein
MDLSPNDVRNYKFSSQMRGYSKDEVDSFLEKVAEVLETAKQESLKLSMEIEALKSQVSGLKQFEDTIKSAAIDARRSADMLVTNAKQEAQMLLSKAKQEAEDAVNNRNKSVAVLESQITKLSLTKKSYLNKVRGLIQSHLEMLEEIDTSDLDLSEFDKPEPETKQKPENLEITGSEDMTTKRRETVATRPSQQVMKTEEGSPQEESRDEETPEEIEEQLSENLKDAIQSDEPASEDQPEPEPVEEPEAEPEPEAEEAEEGPIDPELAAALESYKKAAQQAPMQEEEPEAKPMAPPMAPPADLNRVVETNKRAEDIPDGFVPASDELPQDPTTDKVKVEGAPEASVEPNAINPEGETERRPALSPDSIASELDEVAAKFEEEMDKAEKN